MFKKKKSRKKKLASDTAAQQEKIIAVTLGDPEGIGPEIVYKSLKRGLPRYPIVIIGNRSLYPDKTVALIDDPQEIRQRGVYFHHLPVEENQKDISFRFVETGINWALSNKIQALVTAPI